ncbi:hypothetical protein HYPSUDRAFT_41528 [Hypholoma sublateritium FD-334 SS-4]|uniref:Uncharacterized protein n=1 Tax=Hypholoma sublateritium (strain FD-334 SS-4) TaxID=945553 RepID=A0A0D2NZL6_HYPSF|nr:hypothetical protein HYPSUDRAFT_41528 [Hypholoma sublateritium FD-334 SS-4]
MTQYRWINSSFILLGPSETFYNTYQPDLLVTVDFDALAIPSDSLIDIASNSIQIMVTMTNDTAAVLEMTGPTVLIPGVNMVGLVSMEIHQTFKNPEVATLGVFEYMKSTLVGQVTHLYPDPSMSPLIRRGANISTLRLSVVREATQWNIIRDSKNNSFLGGFSKVGGLWTFLSGIFAAIFGSSLLRVLFGSKPISVFGFAHRWERDTIGEAYHASYPAIREEMTVPPEQRGLLCLIQDHIVDLNLIDEPDFDEADCNDSNELTILHSRSDPSTSYAALVTQSTPARYRGNAEVGGDGTVEEAYVAMPVGSLIDRAQQVADSDLQQ